MTHSGVSIARIELFSVMEQYAGQHGFVSIAYGVNLDDQADFRPGERSAKQHCVAAPLLEAGLTKAEFANSPNAPGFAMG